MLNGNQWRIVYLHEESSSLFSVSPAHVIGWAFVLVGLFFAVTAVHLFRLARHGRPDRDPFKDAWWRQQIKDNQEDSKSPFADLLAQELPEEHPSAPMPAVRHTEAFRAFLERSDKDWKEFLANWDAENPEAAQQH